MADFIRDNINKDERPLAIQKIFKGEET